MVHLAFEEGLLQGVHFFGIAFVEKNALVPLRREHEQLVGIDQRTPEIAVTIEGDAIGPSALTESRRPEDFALHGVAIRVYAQTCDAAARGFDYVHPFLVSIEADLIG